MIQHENVNNKYILCCGFGGWVGAAHRLMDDADDGTSQKEKVVAEVFSFCVALTWCVRSSLGHLAVPSDYRYVVAPSSGPPALGGAASSAGGVAVEHRNVITLCTEEVCPQARVG